MDKIWESSQPRMVITLGQTSIILEPDTILYKHFKKQLGITKPKSPPKHAIVNDLMQVTASSIHPGNCFFYKLNTTQGTTSWSAQTNNHEQYIEAKQKNVVKILGLMTQGRSQYDQWVKKFSVTYSVNGSDFIPLENYRQFVANSDRNTVKENIFSAPVVARAIRIHPTQWHGHISLRFEVLIE